MIKRFIIALILLVVVVGGIVGFNMFRDRAIEQFFANMPVASVTVPTEVVEPQAWTPGIEALGTVNASQGVDLTVETTGVVKEVLFKANQQVKDGDILLQLDDAVEKADLEAGKTQTALYKTTLDRATELRKRGVGSDVTLDQARTAFSASESQVAKLQAVLDQKQLWAPFSGTIGIPRVELGQYLAPGTIVATLQDLETMRADFSIPEQQIGLLKIGRPVRFGVTADDMPFVGTIKGIEPKVDPTSRMVTVRAEITNPEGRLTPGQFVQVEVVLPEEKDVLTVAQTALVTSLYGDFIYVVRPANAGNGAAPAPAAAPADGAAAATSDDAAEPALVATQIFIKPGRRSHGLVEILEGIKPGDQVVTAGQNRLSNGTPVKVDNTVNPAAPAQKQPAVQ
ncbi:efflux RND transporter periplasmic adaptor subunit [Pseudaminobacter arsenicus]|uniref:Efflux RND transporter periplasmic adaptor subunit n=1 Tax=Borborobacter arsenicus TaxID=1851146 RepID=A0A432V572_9HYPH|nr:efflux RND transporter periplasmic adaptor subunit [Pseudaminobacter arsenicus]RUM97296.1 efflux RND transporter periplasmic adaptor subunit [Pseudaminobacter arsenicus]